jgi:hypothetical protein
MTGSEFRGRRGPSRRLVGGLLLALLAAHGPSSPVPSGPSPPAVSAPPAGEARARVPRFDAPNGCRNATLLDFPAAGFPRVLPLTRFCPFEPRTDCLGEAIPERSRLLIRERPDDARKDRVFWKLRKGQAIDAADLGNPRQDTSYELCVYVEVADVCWLVLHPDILPGPGWKAHKRGFSYRAKRGVHPEGIRKLRLRTGADRKARVVLKGQGDLLDLRALPIPPSAEILVQLYNSENQCWSTEFGSDPVIDSEQRYKDRSDP